MLIMRRSAYSGTLVVLCALGSAMAPVRAVGQAAYSLPPAAMNAKLDSLERLVLLSGSCSPRNSALAAIAISGWARNDTIAPPPPYPGIVARLERIYRQARECDLRGSVIPLMIRQAERDEAVAFLAGVAQEPAPPPASPPPGVAMVLDNPWTLQTDAISALTYLGQPGEAALRRLHAEGMVREPFAKAMLDRIAREGFRRPGN